LFVCDKETEVFNAQEFLDVSDFIETVNKPTNRKLEHDDTDWEELHNRKAMSQEQLHSQEGFKR